MAKKIYHFTFRGILICYVYGFVMCNVCKDVNFGIEGIHMCPTNCTECALHDYCMLCQNSLSGSTCRVLCTVGCIRVFVPNGTWVTGCYKKQVGEMCCIKCPGYNFCSLCSDFYGHCMKCSTGMYDIRTQCDKRCGHCRSDNDNAMQCDIYTGDCTGDCDDGYFGQRCDQICDKYCLDPATNTKKCEKQSGNCIFGCVPGRYNDTCTAICSSTCLSSSCNKDSGACTAGCIPGWYGDTCEKTCSDICVGKSCHQVSGQCTDGCLPGWYGDTCEEICSSSCINKICNQLTGHCERGCLAGWYGIMCKEICNSSCVNNACDRFSGHCDSGCLMGWYGVMCETICSSSCNNNSCDQYSGHCNSGCVPSRHGDTCDKVCSSSCIDNTCNQFSGSCDKGCVPGWHGATCEATCSTSCFNRECSRTSGYCEHGCIHGWYGEKCEMPCSVTCFNRSCGHLSAVCENGCVAGFYGNYCESSCSDACVLRKCDNNHQCVLGCKKGFEGDFCNQSYTASTTYSHSAALLTTGISAGTVIALVICTCLIRFIQKTVVAGRRHCVRDLPTEQITERIYDEISNAIDVGGSAEIRHTYIELSGDPVQGSLTSSNASNVNGQTTACEQTVTGMDETLNSEHDTKSPRVSYEIPITGASVSSRTRELPGTRANYDKKSPKVRHLCSSYTCTVNTQDHETFVECCSDSFVDTDMGKKSRERSVLTPSGLTDLER